MTAVQLEILALRINELFCDIEAAETEAENYRTVAIDYDTKAQSHRVQAGKMLLEAKRLLNASGSNRSWREWCAEHIERSERDIRRLVAIAKAADPEAAHEAEKAKTRDQVGRSRKAGASDIQIAVCPLDMASGHQSNRPVVEIRIIARNEWQTQALAAEPTTPEEATKRYYSGRPLFFDTEYY